MFTAKIWTTQFRGEQFHHGQVTMPGKGWSKKNGTHFIRPVRVFSVADQPTRQAVCLEIRDWALRQGKTGLIEWQYDH